MLERGKRSDIYSLFFFPVEVRDGRDTRDKGMGVPPIRTRHEKKNVSNGQDSAGQGWHRETKPMPLARNTTAGVLQR